MPNQPYAFGPWFKDELNRVYQNLKYNQFWAQDRDLHPFFQQYLKLDNYAEAIEFYHRLQTISQKVTMNQPFLEPMMFTYLQENLHHFATLLQVWKVYQHFYPTGEMNFHRYDQVLPEMLPFFEQQLTPEFAQIMGEYEPLLNRVEPKEFVQQLEAFSRIFTEPNLEEDMYKLMVQFQKALNHNRQYLAKSLDYNLDDQRNLYLDLETFRWKLNAYLTIFQSWLEHNPGYNLSLKMLQV